jgi:hypothetical protein
MENKTYSKYLPRRESRPSSFVEIQVYLSQLTRQAGREALADWLASCEGDDPPGITKCRHCGSDAIFVSKKPRFLHTQFGTLRYERAYYVCRHCYGSTCPLDERLDPLASLARLRRLILEGQSISVDVLAKSWGLGSVYKNLDASLSVNLFNTRVNQILQCV